MSSKIANVGAAALAGVLALTSAAPALAQPGPYTAQDRSGYYYDPCKRDQTNRGTAGALIGGGMGAVIGSNAAARNARTEGALLGGLLGAIAGGVVGNKSAACSPQQTYYDTRAEVLPPPPPPRAEPSYYERDAYSDGAWREDDRYRVADRPRESAEDCTLAESPIHMPDGRTQTRFVRVCRDASGKYAVVD